MRKLRSIIFVIIESDVALFAIELARLMITSIEFLWVNWIVKAAYILITGIHAMSNVFISSVNFVYVLLITLTWLGYSTYHHLGAGVNEIVFPQWVIFGRSCW